MRQQQTRRNFTDANVAELAILDKKYEVRDTKLPRLYARGKDPDARYIHSLRGGFTPTCGPERKSAGF